jgi:hypothetical protein
MAFRTATKQDLVVGQVRKALKKTFKWDSQANVSVVLRQVTDSMTLNDIDALVQKLAAENRLAQNQEWSEPFREFYDAYPQYKIDANESILIRALIDNDKGLNFDDLVYVAGIPGVVECLAVTAQYQQHQRGVARAEAQAEREQAEAAAIREEMLGWLVNGPREAQLKRDNIHPSVYQGEARKEQKRLDAMSHAELVAEVTRRREVRRVRGLDAKAFRAEVAASRNQPTQEQQQTAPQSGYSQFEQIPDVYKTRSGQEIVMTSKSLIELANRDTFAFRECVRRFGADVINNILAGRV